VKMFRISRLISSSERGLAMTILAAAPSLGPSIGLIVGNFLGQAKGWRWVEGFLAIFADSV
jgi:predicted MFS family arabinose efflux permease